MIEGYPEPAGALSAWYGRTVRVEHSRFVGGGSINRTAVLTLDNGARVFLKQNDGSVRGLFRAEAVGLEALRCEGGPAVARPVALYESGESQYLLLEFIDSAPRVRDFWRRFGRSMACLHRTRSEGYFGFSLDNHIGSTEQINTPTDRWIPFFAEYRLGYQIALAERTGRADGAMVRGVRRIIEKLDRHLFEPEHPSILHGDLWGGNYVVGPDGTAVLIDPAVYFGHQEADLAMTELFGGFSPSFIDAYREANPLREGYRDRVDIYNLYHVLNHLNLFGSGYAGAVRATIARYG